MLLVCVFIRALSVAGCQEKFEIFRQPFGIKMCSSLSSVFGTCESVAFVPGQLACFLGNYSGQSSDTVYLTSRVMNRTFMWYRKIVSRKKQIVKVKEKRLSKTEGNPVTRDDTQADYKLLTFTKPHCFVKLHYEEKTWDEALQVCGRERATLVKIGSWLKNKKLLSEFKNKTRYAWIGLRKQINGDVLWRDGSAPKPFSNWERWQPPSGRESLSRPCVMIRLGKYHPGKWITKPCKLYRGFICQKFEN